MHLSYPANQRKIKNLMITVEAMSHEIERKGSHMDYQERTESSVRRRRFTTGKKMKLQKGDKGRNREGGRDKKGEMGR